MDEKLKYFFNQLESQKLPQLLSIFNPKGHIIDNIINLMHEFPPGLIIDKTGLSLNPSPDNKRYTLLGARFNEEEQKLIVKSTLFFRSLYYIYELYESELQMMECPNYSICDYENRDENCLTKPWYHSHNENTCEFGIASFELGYNLLY